MFELEARLEELSGMTIEDLRVLALERRFHKNGVEQASKDALVRAIAADESREMERGL